MPHVDNKNLSNYQGILGQQVLMIFEHLKNLILQPLSGDLTTFPICFCTELGTLFTIINYQVFFKQRDCIFLNKEVPRCGSQILPLLSTTADSLYHCCMSGYMATKTAKNQNQSNSTLNNQHAPYHLTPKAREYFGHCCIPNLSFQFLLEVCMFHLSVFSLEEGSAAFAPFPALSWCQCPLLALGYPGSTSPTVSLEGHISKVPFSCTKCSSDHLKGRNTTRGFLLKIQTCSSCP